MKSIRLTLLIILAAVSIFISSQIDQTISFFSRENLNLLFGILLCLPLSSAVLYLTGKMEGIDKRLYPKKSSFIWLYICFAWMCISLIAIAYFNRKENVTGMYFVFSSAASASYLLILNIRDDIRKKMSEEQSSNEVEVKKED